MASNAIDTDNITVAYLKSEDLSVAASILYNAYFDDPLFKEIFDHQKEGYEARLRSSIREEINTFWEAEQPLVGLYEGRRLLAVTCLTSPDASFGAGRLWHWRLKMLLTAGYYGTTQMIEKEKKFRDSIDAENYHMISLMGVHTDYQDMGLGHLLMNSLLLSVDEEPTSQGVGVLVTIPKCVSFFEDANFHHVCPIDVAGMTANVMFREKNAS